MRKKILLLFGVFIIGKLFAQTYATPELKMREEMHIAVKNTQLGIKKEEATMISSDIHGEEKMRFDLSLLAETYRFTDITTIDYQNKHNSQELAAATMMAKEDFSRMHFAIANDLQTLYIANKENVKDYVIHSLTNTNATLSIKNCKECQGDTYKIISQTENQLILELIPQDEWNYFIFRITLKK